MVRCGDQSANLIYKHIPRASSVTQTPEPLCPQTHGCYTIRVQKAETVCTVKKHKGPRSDCRQRGKGGVRGGARAPATWTFRETVPGPGGGEHPAEARPAERPGWAAGVSGETGQLGTTLTTGKEEAGPVVCCRPSLGQPGRLGWAQVGTQASSRHVLPRRKPSKARKARRAYAEHPDSRHSDPDVASPPLLTHNRASPCPPFGPSFVLFCSLTEQVHSPRRPGYFPGRTRRAPG